MGITIEQILKPKPPLVVGKCPVCGGDVIGEVRYFTKAYRKVSYCPTCVIQIRFDEHTGQLISYTLTNRKTESLRNPDGTYRPAFKFGDN